MSLVPVRLPPDAMGSMVDSVDEVLHQERGRGLMREWRNTDHTVGGADSRPTWDKINTTAMPWTAAIGIFSWHDSKDVRHVIVVGDDGNIYHDLNWLVPAMVHDPVIWDGTYQASFAPHGDDCYIALGSMDGSVCNLRYDGLMGEVFGVGMAAPAAPTVADGGVVADGLFDQAYRYRLVAVHDPAVGRLVKSPAGPSVEIIFAAADHRATLTLPVATAATYPGRTIEWEIYRSADGTTYTRLATVANGTLTYQDADAIGGSITLRDYSNMPVMRYVAKTPDGRVLWFNDEENEQPAIFHIGIDYDNPEVYGESDYVGTGDDPITAPHEARDGIFIGKKRSIQWLNDFCKTCEGMIGGVGCVAWATVQVRGAAVAWLSERGPCVTDHALSTDFRFVGTDVDRFCMPERWAGVVKERLPFASSFHDPVRGLMGWWVQTCPQAEGKDDFNDTIIWWDYAAPVAGGRVGIWDMMGCHACTVRAEGSDLDEVWAAFPYGFIGKMFGNQYGDGINGDAYVYGQFVLSQSGTLVFIDDSEWTYVGSGWQGSVLHIYSGLNSRSCRDALPCDRPNLLIKSHRPGTIELATEVALDETSAVWVGGFKYVGDLTGLGFRVPTAEKNLVLLDLQLQGN